jgi:hypothetical protein
MSAGHVVAAKFPGTCAAPDCDVRAMVASTFCESHAPALPGTPEHPDRKPPPLVSAEHLVSTGVYQWRAEPITSSEQARYAILRWLGWVEEYHFPEIVHRDPKQRERGVRNRRATLRAVGETALERNPVNIRVTVDAREIARRANLSLSTVQEHLKREAKLKRFLKIWRSGASNPHGGFATIYHLHVDRQPVAA